MTYPLSAPSVENTMAKLKRETDKSVQAAVSRFIGF
jgi:hypothetical protein